MKEFDSPLKIWDYCAERRVLINNLISKNLFQLNGSNANLKIVEDAGDISNLCSLGWFEWFYFQDRSPFVFWTFYIYADIQHDLSNLTSAFTSLQHQLW